MTGAQYLEKGVYIYTSEIRDGESSQSFVGLCEGEQSVDISMSMTMSFDVEDAAVLSERIWRNEWAQTPDGGDSDDGGDSGPPPENPLENVPKTGGSLPWEHIGALSALGLFILRSKKAQ